MLVVEVARELGRDVKDVLEDGYFKNHRTWDILNEIKARETFESGIVASVPHLTEEARQEFYNNLEERQPRRKPPSVEMPVEVHAEFVRKWAEIDGRRKQTRNRS